MKRKLFCEISPLTYSFSRKKRILTRQVKDSFHPKKLAKTFDSQLLPYVVSKHNSLIRRILGNVDLQLQENKAKNLALASGHLNNLLIRPGETFSFWNCVGECKKELGYKEGLTIKQNKTSQGIGGGMCQMTNLIHWMVLHSPLTIVEHHHHGRFDLFPDFNRVIPFGTGTSISYNYLDYRFENRTPFTFQLIIYTTDQYLCGQLRINQPLPLKWHIVEVDSWFSHEEDGAHRHNIVRRKAINKLSGTVALDELVIENDALVMYDNKLIDPTLFR